MKRNVLLEFSEFGERVTIELDDSDSPKTVMTIIDSLPIRVTINRWGDELYSDEIPVRVAEENSKSIVNLFDVAYWPEGAALCIFYGPTPISKGRQIVPYSPVNMIGKVITKPVNVREFLNSVERSHIKKKVPIVLH